VRNETSWLPPPDIDGQLGKRQKQSGVVMKHGITVR
jgi:hypothetical protein